MENNNFQYADPYPYYKKLRDFNPVFQDKNGVWFLSRYDHVKMLQSDMCFARQHPASQGFVSNNSLDSKLESILSKWLLLNDPPRHTYLRNVLSDLFDARFIKNMKIMIEGVADSTIKSMMKQPEVNFMTAFSYPYAVTIINNLLGVNLDIDTTRKWAQSLSTALDHGTDEDLKKITPDLIHMFEYFSTLISTYDTKNKNDWISKLIYFNQSKKLSHEEVVSTCIFLLLTGHETVQLTSGLFIRSLLLHPSQCKLLQNNPELLGSSIEEIFRYESAFSRISRWSKEDIRVDGVTIPKNQLVVGNINAANRDERKFTNPDIFDIRRKNNRHIALGHGIHHCLGALLARIELNIAFSKLVPYLHRLELLDSQTEWLPNSSLRYLYNLKIKTSKKVW